MLLLSEGIPSTRGPVSGYLGSCPINRTPIKNKPLAVQAIETVKPEIKNEGSFRRSILIRRPNDIRIKLNKKPHFHHEERILLISPRLEQHAHALRNPKDKTRTPKRKREENDDAWPSPEPPNWGARLWGSAIAEPRRRRSSAIQWPSSPRGRGPPAGSPTARFDDTFRRFEVFRGSNDL